MHVELRFVLVIDEAFEDIEDSVEAKRCVDKMKAFLPCRRSFLTHQRYLLDKGWMELLKMCHCDARTVQDSNLTGNHIIVVFAHENVLDHVAYLYDFCECVQVGVVCTRSD